MWLVMGLPAVVVAAGIAMIVVAGGDGSTDTTPDRVQRTAQIQTADLGPDAVARQDKLSAVLRIDAEAGRIELLPVSGAFDRAGALQLTLVHPARASGDLAFELQPGELGWHAQAEPEVLAKHDWNVRLQPPDGRWRLQGRLPTAQLAVHLRPSLGAP